MREQGRRDSGRWHGMRGMLRLWAVLAVIWAAANASVDPVVLGVGVAITGGIAGVLTRRATPWDGLATGLGALVAFLSFTAIFLREMIRSNLAMLRIVYAPRIDIRPGVVPTRTVLKSPLGRFVLTNTVTLTPGSLVMGLDDATVTVHVLDLAATDIDANTAAVSGAFEPALERAFG